VSVKDLAVAGSSEPPFCSWHMLVALLVGAACTAVARVAIAHAKVGNTDPSRWSYGHFGSYINGINSCWIVVPGIISLSTSSQQLASLSPRVARLRHLVLGVGVCACITSIFAWRQWNVVVGTMDQLLATSLLFGIYILGVQRGGWICVSTASLGLSTVIFVVAEKFLEDYQPYPHEAFRMCGVLAGLAALNGGLRVPNLWKLLQVGVPLCAIWLGHVVLEWQLARCWEKQYCTYLFEPTPYLIGIGRNLACIFLFLTVAYFVLRGKMEDDPRLGDVEEAEGMRESLTTAACDQQADAAEEFECMKEILAKSVQDGYVEEFDITEVSTKYEV